MDKKIFHIVLLLIIGFTAYSHIFPNPFVIDDDEFIVKWDATRSFRNIPSFFKGLTPGDHQGVYRPVRSVLYAAAYKLSGVNPFGYHLISIIVHLSSTLLVYLILVSIMRDNIVALISAVIFTIHPVHVESITYMASTFDVAGVTFAFLAFYLYLRYNTSGRYIFLILSVFLSLIAFFNYEITLIFPFLIILYNVCFGIRKRFAIYLPYFISVLLYIITRLLVIGIGGKGGHVLGNAYYTMLLMPMAFLRYISLMFLPVGLNMNHELYPSIYSMLYTGYDRDLLSLYSFRDPRVLAPLIIIMTGAYAGIKYYWKAPIISFCIWWFFISLGAVTNIIPTGIIMAEKYLYLASFGYCLFISYLLVELYKRKKTRYISCIISCAISLFYFKGTVVRNLEWRNPLFLWDMEAQRFPNSPHANNNLGYAYIKTGQYTEALRYLGKAKTLSPYNLQTRENLEVCYISMGEYDKAIDECMDVLGIVPPNNEYYKTYVNLSAAYNGKGDYDNAVRYAKKAIELKPDCREGYINLGIAEDGKRNLSMN